MTTKTAETVAAALAVELRVALLRSGMTQTEAASAVGQQPPWLSRRMVGHTDFTVADVVTLCEALGADPVDVLSSALLSCAADS